MAKYEITIIATIEAVNDADAEKKRASFQKQAPSLKGMLSLQGINVVGDVVVKSRAKA